MKLVFLFLSALAVNCTALPYFDLRNVVTVPPNCPVGQVWVNGQCRDIWRLNNPDDLYPQPAVELLQQDSDFKNMVTVPPNCPVGQVWVNGQCRDIWRLNNPDDIYSGPTLELREQDYSQFINDPVDCANGEIWIPQLELCRVLESQDYSLSPNNVVTVPPNCPDGQEFVNGQCRDIWRRNSLLLGKLDEDNDNIRTEKKVNIRRVINVPNQCPTGQRPDALGICRPILD